MRDADPLAGAVSRFGASPEPKLSGKGAAGAQEDQPRAPWNAPSRTWRRRCRSSRATSFGSRSRPPAPAVRLW